MKIIVLIVALLVAGCQSMLPNQGYDPNLTSQQIKAIASDKNAAVICAQIPTPLGPAKTIVVNVDQRVVDNGGVMVNPDCSIDFRTVKPVVQPKEK